MGKVYERIDDGVRDFIAAQHMFFIATAPLSGGGLVNLSPKGLDTFRILDEHTVAYLDLTGSGVETVAHLKENGRFVVMFCAFEGAPRIVRLHGKGEALERGDEGFDELVALFPDLPGTRTVVRLGVERVSDSCGWSVPVYEYRAEREQLVNFSKKLGEEGLRAAQLKGNMKSLDGLPGLSRPSV
jgi:hypothetical protein